MEYKLEKIKDDAPSSFIEEHRVATKLCSKRQSMRERWVDFESNNVFYIIGTFAGPGNHSVKILLFLNGEKVSFWGDTEDLICNFKYRVLHIDTSEEMYQQKEFLEEGIKKCLTEYCKCNETAFISVEVRFDYKMYRVLKG